MYKIYADNLLIYDDTSSDPYLKVTSPKLSLAENSAGSLSITIPYGNAGYDTIVLMNTDITVTKDDEYFWAGRVLQEKKDFWNNRVLTCEGELAFLNDTTQNQRLVHYAAMRTLLNGVLKEHNDHVPENRRIYVNLPDDFEAGLVTAKLPSGGIDYITNYEKTIECINKLSEEYNAIPRIRRVKRNGVEYRVLDFLKVEKTNDRPDTNTQRVEFGKNLIEYASSCDFSEYATVIVPLGEKLKDEEGAGIEGIERYLTVESVTPDRSRYVKSDTAIEERGWIEKVVHFDDISSPLSLMHKAESYLADLQFENLQIDITAFDLHYLNPDIEDIRLSDIVRVVSVPHNVDHRFVVVKLEIPLDQPQNATYQLGTTVKNSMTAVNNKLNSEILERLSKTPDINEDAILKAAKDDAAALMNQHLNGYVTITTDDNGSNELYISDERPLFKPDEHGEPTDEYNAKRFWKWGLSGLGYTDDGGETWKTAMTMDGSIIGDRIAAGSIHGSKITAGSLALTTAAGETGLSIGLTTRGLAPRSFEVGDINGNDGKNIDDDKTKGRTVWKSFLKAGTIVTVINSIYKNKAFIYEYMDANEAESGFVEGHAYGINWDETENVGKYTVRSDGYYRFVLYSSSSSVTASELERMSQAIQFSGSSAVITADQLEFIGLVKLVSLSNPSSVTFIDGANIITETVTADKINIRGLIVTTGYGSNKRTTFEINDEGKVYVDGEVKLSGNSVISFDSGEKTIDDTISDLADEPIAKSIANGSFSDSSTTFISKNKITSPVIMGGDIYGSRFIGSNPSGIEGAMLTFYDGKTNLDIGVGSLVGALGYDFRGTGDDQSSKERLIMSTQLGKAIKLQSGAGLSLSAQTYIYMDTLTRLDSGFATAKGVGFGSATERSRITPVPGQVFFQIN